MCQFVIPIHTKYKQHIQSQYSGCRLRTQQNIIGQPLPTASCLIIDTIANEDRRNELLPTRE